MELTVYQINAFSNRLKEGNPACVIPLETWLPAEIMLAIAKKNGLPETAFFIKNENTIQLRWFTPDIEMDLCGHATLATAHCLQTHLGYSQKNMAFETQSGLIDVNFSNGFYHMDLPAREGKLATLPQNIYKALSMAPKEVYKSRDYLLVYDNQSEIEKIKVNRKIFDLINMDPGGVIVTAPGNKVDFVSRFFTPQASILEDPVTGSAHCTLIPYWSERLQKKEMSAKQLSKRGGALRCVNNGERVIVSGAAITCLKSTLKIDELS
jgi:PhzF family phenazine biosynthesis protein